VQSRDEGFQRWWQSTCHGVDVHCLLKKALQFRM